MVLRLWGSETLVNTTAAGNQLSPSVAALSNGGYMIGWQDSGPASSVIRLQQYDAFGKAVGVETTLDYAASAEMAPALAALPGGNVGVLLQYAFSGTDNDLYFSTVTPGPVIGGTTGVAASGANQDQQVIDGVPIGTGFVAAYNESIFGSGATDVILRDSDGAIVPVTADLSGSQYVIGVDYTSFRSLTAVAFIDEGVHAVKFSIYDESTNAFIASGGSFTVNGFNTIKPGDVAWITDDEVVMTWREASIFGSSPTNYLQVGFFNTVLRTATQFFIANADESDVQQLRNGMAAVAYHDTLENTVKLQLVNEYGQKVGAPVTLSQDFAIATGLPAMTELNDGRILVTWTSSDPAADGSGSAVISQIVDPRDGLVTGTALAETLVGHNAVGDQIQGFGGADTLWGLAGNDALYGGGSSDTLNGGKGDDEGFGGAGDDTLIGGAGDDDLYGGAGGDTLKGGAGGDLLNGGAGSDVADFSGASTGITAALDNGLAGTGEAAGDVFVSIERLRGTGFADTLRGSVGGDTMSGEAGNDSLAGLSGNDTLRGGIGNDTISGGNGQDIFLYVTTAEGGDTITDFSAADDNFSFVSAGFGGLPTGPISANRFLAGTNPAVLDPVADANVRFYYETDTRTLWYDSDGPGAAAAIAIATIQTGASLTAADIIIV